VVALRPSPSMDAPSDPIRDADHHVDVAEAEATFNELSRQLSRQSRKQSTIRGSTSDDGKNIPKDVEKAEPEERFDLREYLTSSNDANQQAGIQHKHVGVVWEDLQVSLCARPP
jgi:ATP-binding cassette, subfamily G (WHITE), member 2, SNQ2